MGPQKSLRRGIILVAAVITAGCIGYMQLEGWSFGEAIYMTVITISTVGFSEVQPLTSAGRIFTIGLIAGGVGAAALFITAFAQYVTEGRLRSVMGRRQMKARIAKLKDHFILCGYGRVGEDIARTFNEEGVPFVVVDSRPDNIAMAQAEGYLHLLGDATSDRTLTEAGIERARGLVAAVGDDADNTFITLSARGIRPDLFIEARASSAEVETKLRRAGADRVVSPNSIGARRMALLAIRPTVVEFIDTVSFRRGRELQLENVAVTGNSPLIDQTAEAISQKSKANILAISKKTGKLVVSPGGEEIIEAGDRLIIMGKKEQLTTLEKLCQGESCNE